jgi:hypothetical protein
MGQGRAPPVAKRPVLLYESDSSDFNGLQRH